MGLKEAFESLLQIGKPSRKVGDCPVSIVLFLREQRFPTLEQLRLAAERAFRRSFSGDKNSRYCVYQQVLFTLARIGPHTLSVLFYTKPYGADDPDFGIALPLVSQRQAWAEHTSWVALNYVKGVADIDSLLWRAREALR